MSSSRVLLADSWPALVKSWEFGAQRDLSQARLAFEDISASSPSAVISLQAMKRALDDTREASDSTIQGLYVAGEQTHPDYLMARFAHLEECLKGLHSQLRDDSRMLGQRQDGTVLIQLASLTKGIAGTTVGWEDVRQDLELRGGRGHTETVCSLRRQMRASLEGWEALDRYIPNSTSRSTSRRSLSEDGKWHALNVDQYLAQIKKCREDGTCASLVLSRETEKSIRAYIDMTTKLDKIMTPGLAEMLKWRKVRKAHSSTASGTTASSRLSGEVQPRASRERDRDGRHRGVDERDGEARETYRFETIFKVASDLATIKRSARSLAVFAAELIVPVREPCLSTRGGKTSREGRTVRFKVPLSHGEDELRNVELGVEAFYDDERIRQTGAQDNIPHRPDFTRVRTTPAELFQQDDHPDADSSDDDSTIADYHNSDLAEKDYQPRRSRQTANIGIERQSRSTTRDGRSALPPRGWSRASSPYLEYDLGSDEKTIHLRPSRRRSNAKDSSSVGSETTEKNEPLAYGDLKGDEWVPHRFLSACLLSCAAVTMVQKAGEMLEKHSQAKESASTEVSGSKSNQSKRRGPASSVAGDYTRARHDNVV